MSCIAPLTDIRDNLVDAAKSAESGLKERRRCHTMQMSMAEIDILHSHFRLNASHAGQGSRIMAMLAIGNLPDEVHRALRARAVRHGHSIEAEVREVRKILADVVMPQQRLRLGTPFASRGHKIGLTNEDCEALEKARDKTPAKAMSFD